MADLVITATDVEASTGAKVETGTIGAAITAGDVVYIASATEKLQPATNATEATAAAVGIALNGGGADQPARYQRRGLIDLGAVLTVGEVYAVSLASGAIAPVADLGSGAWVTILGVAKTTSLLLLEPIVSGVAKP